MKGIVPIVRRGNQGSGRHRSRYGIIFLLLWSIFLGGISSWVGATCTAGFVALPQAPKTFSGTNCVLNAWVSTDVGYVTDATIYIGGQETVTVQNLDPTKTRIDFGVIWDSTHFAHNSSIQLLVVGHNSQVPPQEGRSNRIFLDKIYNKGSVFSFSYFESLRPVVSSIRGYLESMNYGITTSSGVGWTEKKVLDSVKVDTAFHYSTHVTPDEPPPAKMQVDTIAAPDTDGWVTYGQVGSAQQQRTAPVGVNFVFLNGCYSCSDAWWDAYGIQSSDTDRAYVGWVNAVAVVGGQNAAVVLWNRLSSCWILGDALEDAQQQYEDTQQGYPVHFYG